MSIEYDTETVGSWSEMSSYMDEPENKDYVSGSGPWAIKGEMSTTRYRTKPQAYGAFLTGLLNMTNLKIFSNKLVPKTRKNFMLAKVSMS